MLAVAALVVFPACGDSLGPAEDGHQIVRLEGTAIDDAGVPRAGWTVTGTARPTPGDCWAGAVVLARDSTVVRSTGYYTLRLRIPTDRATCIRVDLSTRLSRPDTTFNGDGTTVVQGR